VPERKNSPGSDILGAVKCPECGLDLHKVSILGIDDSFRCANCGSIRMAGWVINRIAEGEELKVVPTGKAGGKTAPGRSLACPEDGGWMVESSGGELPPDVPVWQCGKCKWWWVPGDNVFDLKHAFEVKREYNQRWRKGSPITGFALPVVLTMILTIGLGMAVMSVRDRTLIQTQAESNIEQVVVIYSNGKAEVRFISKGDPGVVAYKRQTDTEWIQVSPVKIAEWSRFEVDGVTPGEKIWVSFGVEIRQMTVGKEL